VRWLVAAAFLAGGALAGLGVDRLATELPRRRGLPQITLCYLGLGRTGAVVGSAALLWAGCWLAFGLHRRLGVALLFCTVLVAISAIDLEHRVVPNRIVLPAAAVVLAAQTAIDPSVEWTRSRSRRSSPSAAWSASSPAARSSTPG